MAISPFAVGQLLPVMQVQLFTEGSTPTAQGVPLDITGLTFGNFTLNIYNVITKTDQLGQGSFIIVNASQGIIRYAWALGDTSAAGTYQLFVTATYSGNPLTFDPIPFTIVPK